MNRLTDIYNGTLHSQIVYDPLGRMTDKQADGQVVFANASFDAAPGQPAQPHAIKCAETAEGVFPAAQQQITYTAFDKVKSISEDGNDLIVNYGYDQQRIRSYLIVSDNRFINKDYVGLCEYNTEYFVDRGAIQTTLTYLVGPYGVFAVVEKGNNWESIHYILKDHLGSWTSITDSEGNVEQEISFDAWGNLRDPETWLNYPTDETTLSLMFDRGFTGHEHMTTFGLINMNGRCYDPLTSSFLSVDAYVQDPTSAQGFNRYAYCSYNPLRYTDPTGWYQQPGTNPTPNINLIGTTTYHSDDPCEMLWGRSVHPTQAANPTGFNSTSAGYTIGNDYNVGGQITNGHGGIGGWIKNVVNGTYYYDDNATIETSGFVSLTFVSGSTYYGLFGEKYDLNTLEGRLAQCFDNCIIEYDVFCKSLSDPTRDPYDQNEPLQKKTDFSQVTEFKRNNYIHRNNNYLNGEGTICVPNNKELLQLKLSCLSDLTPEGDMPQSIRTFSQSNTTSYEKGYQLYFMDKNDRAQAWVNFTTKKSRNSFLNNYKRTFGY